MCETRFGVYFTPCSYMEMILVCGMRNGTLHVMRYRRRKSGQTTLRLRAIVENHHLSRTFFLYSTLVHVCMSKFSLIFLALHRSSGRNVIFQKMHLLGKKRNGAPGNNSGNEFCFMSAPRSQIYGALKIRDGDRKRKNMKSYASYLFSDLCTRSVQIFIAIQHEKVSRLYECALFHIHNGVSVHVSYLVLMLIARTLRKFRYHKVLYVNTCVALPCAM